MWPFEPARESLCFLRGPLEWLMVVKNVNVIYVFDWRSHVFESVVMLTTKFLLDDKITACVKQICLLGVICKVSDRKTLTNEKFCSLRNICFQYFTNKSSRYICHCLIWRLFEISPSTRSICNLFISMLLGYDILKLHEKCETVQLGL